MTSCAVKFIERLLPLFLALWVKVDMILDIRQTITYYRHGFDDGVYAKWAAVYQKQTNTTYLQSVSKIYFITSSVIWITGPLLLSIFGLLLFKEPLFISTDLLASYLNCNIKMPFKNWYAILLGILLLPLDLIGSGVTIYILVPYAALKRGIKIAWTGKDYLGHHDIIPSIPMAQLPALKAFEFLGEALPQLILAIIFTSNNLPYLSENQTYFGISECSISLVSMIFSAGSLCFGLYTGIPAIRLIYWYYSNIHNY